MQTNGPGLVGESDRKDNGVASKVGKPRGGRRAGQGHKMPTNAASLVGIRVVQGCQMPVNVASLVGESGREGCLGASKVGVCMSKGWKDSKGWHFSMGKLKPGGGEPTNASKNLR